MFSHKNKEVYHPLLYFNGLAVIRADSHEHLGIILDSKLTFLDHVNAKIKTTTKILGTLRYFRKYLPLNTNLLSLSIQELEVELLLVQHIQQRHLPHVRKYLKKFFQ